MSLNTSRGFKSFEKNRHSISPRCNERLSQRTLINVICATVEKTHRAFYKKNLFTTSINISHGYLQSDIILL